MQLWKLNNVGSASHPSAPGTPPQDHRPRAHSRNCILPEGGGFMAYGEKETSLGKTKTEGFLFVLFLVEGKRSGIYEENS